MADIYEVVLESGNEIKFPKKCVVCRHTHSGLRTSIDNLQTNSEYDEKCQFGVAKKAKIPIHRRCKSWLQFSASIRLGLPIFIFLLAAMFLRFEYGYPRYILSIFVVVPALFTSFIWNKNIPLPFKCKKRKKMIAFSFIDKDYAQEFAMLNNAKVT